MREITSEEFQNWEHRYRTCFINSLGGFKALCLVGTINENGHTNLAPFNSLIHIGAHPALMGLLFRPDSVERHTLTNIRNSKVYSINLVPNHIMAQAHQCAARYDVHTSEFTANQLEPEYLNGFKAPFVKASKIKWSMVFESETEIPINGTSLVIGRVQTIYLPENSIHADGFVNLQDAETLCVSGLDAYHLCHPPVRFAYAKPHSVAQHIL